MYRLKIFENWKLLTIHYNLQLKQNPFRLFNYCIAMNCKHVIVKVEESCLFDALFEFN